MRAARLPLRMVPVVALTAGLAACADPSSAPPAMTVGYNPAALYYAPVPRWSPPQYRAPSWSPPMIEDPPAYVPRVIERPSLGGREPAPSAPAREPDPIPIVVAVAPPLRGVAPGRECGWWRLCNLPGWRYEN